MREHKLKTWPTFYAAIVDGTKTFELRQNDRDFAVGDRLVLEEWDPAPLGPISRGYTGRSIEVDVTYVMHGGRFGLPQGLVVMGIRAQPAPAAEKGK